MSSAISSVSLEFQSTTPVPDVFFPQLGVGQPARHSLAREGWALDVGRLLANTFGVRFCGVPVVQRIEQGFPKP
jgi:hypothetical protein